MKKEWWTVKSPGMFQNRDFTKSPINVTQGKSYSHDNIKGRIFEISVGDLNPGSKTAYQKMRLVVDDTSDMLWNEVVATVRANDFQILAGWEVLYHVPDTSYIMDSTNLQWTMHPYIKEVLSQAVLCSKSKAIVIFCRQRNE